MRERSPWDDLVRRRLSGLDLDPPAEADVVEELAQHLELVYARARAEGASQSEANRSVLAELEQDDALLLEIGRLGKLRGRFGRARSAVERIPTLSNSRGGGLESLWVDLVNAVRTLLRKPGLAALAALTLALGIGANTVIFSAVSSVLLRPIPYADPDRLVLVWGAEPATGEQRSQVSATDVVDLRARNRVLEEIATYSDWRPIFSGATGSERIPALLVGDGFFKVMRVKPLLGRLFLPREQEEGNDFAVVLSYGLWRSRFNGNPRIVGKDIELNLRKYTVVGVLPADFHSLPTTLIEAPAQLYRPVAEAYDQSERDSRHLRAIARLGPRTSLQQAQAELSLIMRQLEKAHPDTNTGQSVHLVALREDYVREIRPALLMLSGAVALVLLIACANASNLLLTRALARRRELSIRASLGASRSRLARQILTESTLVALAGGVGGLLIAWGGIRFVAAFGASVLPQLEGVAIAPRVLAFCFTVAILAGLVAGLGPAFFSLHTDLNQSLKQGGRDGYDGAMRDRMRGALVAGQVALALVLVSAAGLLIVTLVRLQAVDLGFEPDQVVKMDLIIPRSRYTLPGDQVAVVRRMCERVAQLPGLVAAGIGTPLPISGGFDQTGYEVEGHPVPKGQEPEADRYAVTPGFLRALGVRLVRGRLLEQQDRMGAPAAVLVSESFARRNWPGQDPIGRRIRLPWNPGYEEAPWRSVVGVVRDVRQYRLDSPPTPAFYLPYEQNPLTYLTLVARTQREPAATISDLRGAVTEVDRDLAPFQASTMHQVVAESIVVRRLSVRLLGTFGALALGLATLGIYGVLSYSVAQRRHEIGVRMALGAQRGDVMRLVLRQGLRLTLIGMAAGSLVALLCNRALGSLLFGVRATDLTTLAAVEIVFVSVALAACGLPARRAMQVDPLVALRHD